MKKSTKDSRNAPARPALRTVKLQALLFGGAAASPAGNTPLGTSLPLSGDVTSKWPHDLGE